MRLSGVVFIIVGVAMSLASWILIGQGQRMLLFVYGGIAMAVFGGLRIYLDKDAPKSQVEHRASLARELPVQRHHDDIPKICTVCKTRNSPKANFCGFCGNRL